MIPLSVFGATVPRAAQGGGGLVLAGTDSGGSLTTPLTRAFTVDAPCDVVIVMGWGLSGLVRYPVGATISGVTAVEDAHTGQMSRGGAVYRARVASGPAEVAVTWNAAGSKNWLMAVYTHLSPLAVLSSAADAAAADVSGMWAAVGAADTAVFSPEPDIVSGGPGVWSGVGLGQVSVSGGTPRLAAVSYQEA